MKNFKAYLISNLLTTLLLKSAFQSFNKIYLLDFL